MNIFINRFKNRKSLTDVGNFEILPDESADKALGGYREYKPTIYESKGLDSSWGNNSVLLDSLK